MPVDRAGGQLLAGARFTFDQQVEVSACRAPQLRKGSSHRDRSADELAEGVGAGKLNLSGGCCLLNHQSRLPERYSVTRLNERLQYSRHLDPGSVPAAEVAQEQTQGCAFDLEVPPTDGRIGKNQIVAGIRADPDKSPQSGHLLSLVLPGQDLQRPFADLDLAGGYVGCDRSGLFVVLVHS